MVSVALREVCSGAFGCLLRDIEELVPLPGAVFTVMIYALTFIVIWASRPKQLKTAVRAAIEAGLVTVVVGAWFIFFYSASHQYDNLYRQHQMALQGKETSDAHLKKATEEVIAHQALIIQLGARIEGVEEALKQLREKEEENLRAILPKPKTK